MFLEFLLALRKGGFKISMNEWLSLMEGLRCGYHNQSLDGFYILCRALLVKSETNIDKFDELFYQFFKKLNGAQLIKELERVAEDPQDATRIFGSYPAEHDLTEDDIRRAIDPFIAAADIESEGHGAASESSAKVAGSGESAIGSFPANANGAEGGGGRSVIHARGERKFRDWRTDCTIQSRQFQMAFRLLRELSRKLDTHEEELDIRQSVEHTCSRGGILDIRMQPPRRNRLKLLVLIDSGGSMKPFEKLCSLLFQSLNKANTFSDLKIYYFHNCLEGVVYEDPSIDYERTIKTDWILRNLSGDYKVIFVGDADMAIHELKGSSTNSWRSDNADGITWFKRFKEKYPHSVWLHPQQREENPMWMPESFVEIEKVFPMYRLSIDGLKDAMYKLMKDR